jgi:hypothetical protein
VEGLGAPFSKGVEVDGAELRHVAHGRRADAERRLAINNDQRSHRPSPSRTSVASSATMLPAGDHRQRPRALSEISVIGRRSG